MIEEIEYLLLPEAASVACPAFNYACMAAAAGLEIFKIGGRVVVKKSDLLKFIADGETPAVAK